MPARGSLEGRERPRLFTALVLPATARERIAAWQSEELAGVPEARIVRPGNLHVTLAFLGSRPVDEVEGILRVLADAAGRAARPVLAPARYRETRTVGMLALDDEDMRAGALAADLFAGLEALGVYERERRRWLPHVTVLRFRRAPRLRPRLPDLGPVSPSDVALYHSVLRPGGAQYEIVDSVALGG